MRRITVFICVLGALAIAASAFVATGSARVQGPAAKFLLSANDRFEVAGTRIACRVTQKRAGYTNRLVCFRETKPQSYTPVLGSYQIELAESGVGVSRVGDRGSVFARSEGAPAGAAAGSAQARLLFGGVARLASRQDKVFVEDTNIVCRPYAQTSRAVLCVLMGSDGHVHDGTYLVWISDHGVMLAQARNGKAVTVFRRIHGR
jgi:hypothetical protein